MKSLNLKKTAKVFFISLLFSKGFLQAQNLNVDYYGVVSSSSDTNMLKMAQDVFYNQLKSIDDIIVDDKRPDLSKTLLSIPEFPAIKNRLAFYAEITESKKSNESSGWHCKFNVVTPEDGITHSKSEEFESYYKILVNSKNAIESVLEDLKSPAPGFEQADKSNLETDFKSGIDIESLAGTWTGEPNTDKIIILRGGRGFVIFKNGATMNIKISVKKANLNGKHTDLEITQVGKSNASFFPELPREKALSMASSADPVTWNFALTGPDTLEGSKQTLTEEGSEIKKGTLKSLWSRK